MSTLKRVGHGLFYLSTIRSVIGVGHYMNMPWYVIHSKPHKEIILWREVSARGFECFYPRLYASSMNPHLRKVRPYFPGYLFIQTNIEQVGASTFQWMPFSNGLLSFDGEPAPVPDHLIQAIRRHVDEVNAGRRGQSSELKPGELVIIQSGPFQGYEAIFDARSPGRDRVHVLLKLLQARQVQLELPITQIQRKRQQVFRENTLQVKYDHRQDYV
jgi:transcriptional antiterminator RfaH